MAITLRDLQEYQLQKSFAVRGVPSFAKKMWRDGYNKALQDIVIHFDIRENTVPVPKVSDEGHTAKDQGGQKSPAEIVE